VGWYFVLALVVVPALWLPGTVVLAAAVTAGSPGALAAAVALAAAGWSLVEVLVFLRLTCEGSGPCFN
jgi:uncharacterized membrane protein